MPQIGDAVTFYDQYGKAHAALITNLFGYNSKTERDASYDATYEMQKNNAWCTEDWLANAKAAPWSMPSVNLVYVKDDVKETDPYGQQIARATSVVHSTNQAAHGNYWQ